MGFTTSSIYYKTNGNVMFLSWGWRKTGRYYILISSLCVPHSIYIHRHTPPEDSKHLQKLKDKVKGQNLMISTNELVILGCKFLK